MSEVTKNAKILGVICNQQKVERSVKTHRRTTCGAYFMAFGKTVSVFWQQPRPECERIARKRGVHVRVAEKDLSWKCVFRFWPYVVEWSCVHARRVGDRG